MIFQVIFHITFVCFEVDSLMSDSLDGSSVSDRHGARPTKHISIEFEIRWKFRTL